jgi:hypothetical protein
VMQAAAVAAWTLSAMFIFAGSQKLARPKLAALAIVDFGLARRPRKEFGIAAGVVEIVIGAFAAIPPTSRFGVAGAAGLLLLFAVVLGRASLRGEEFACFCFGESSSEVSWMAAARTALFALGAGTVALAIAWRGRDLASHDEVVAAITGVAVFGSALLGGRVPALRRFNRNFMRPGGAHS